MKEYDVKETIFNFAYRMALNDATLQRAFRDDKKKIEDIVGAKVAVKGYVNHIVNGENSDFYETVNKVRSALKKGMIPTEANSEKDDIERIFTFGNIQKLINMTVKYLYIACYETEEKRENFKSCHCPMDSKMIGIVWKEYKDLTKKDGTLDKKLLEIPSGKNNATQYYSDIRWSKIGFKETKDLTSITLYKNFQSMVSELAKMEGISPIEYDYIKFK